MPPLTFTYIDPETGSSAIYAPPPPDDKPQYCDTRSEKRGDLRAIMDGDLKRLTGDPFAAMWWTLEDYNDIVVCVYGYQLVGWPHGLTFTNLSKVTGGTATLRRLQELWDEKVLKFVPVTDIERQLAAHYPDLFAPAPLCAHKRKTAPRNTTGTFVRPRRRRDGEPKLGPKTPAYVVEGSEDPEDPIVD